MLRLRKRGIPARCHHKASGQDIVRLGTSGFRYLGKHDSAAAKREYARLIAEWLARDGQPDTEDVEGLTIVELCVRFRRWAIGHYRSAEGEPTSEVCNCDQAIRALLAC